MTVNAQHGELPAPIELIAERLRIVFAGRVAPGAVDAVVRGSFTPLANAKILNYVPNLVEHASRDRLLAIVAAVRQPDELSQDRVLVHPHSGTYTT